MEEKFLRLAEKRRSVYNLGKRKILAEDEVIRLVEGMVRTCPSAFNSQSGRVVVLFGENHHKLWNIVKDTLQARVPAEAFGKTEEKINSFAAGYGTVLYFVDDQVMADLQAKFPLYADNFPVWAEQANGILQLIDEKVHEEWRLPQSWRLRAQMPFGSIEASAGEKTYLPMDMRFKVFK